MTAGRRWDIFGGMRGDGGLIKEEENGSRSGGGWGRRAAAGASVAVLAGLALLILLRRGPAPRADVILAPADRMFLVMQEETTLRNVTGRKVSYIIGEGPVAVGRKARDLEPGAMDRIITPSPFGITYFNGANTVEYTAFPGRPYCFRLNERGLIKIYPGSHQRADAADLAPYVPTPPAVVDRMLEMAGVGPSDVVYDPGCGDGRMVIAAAACRGARGVGLELDPELLRQCRENAAKAGVQSLVRFLDMDATKARFVEASVVLVYLLPESLDVLRPMFERDLKSGARVVSHNYRVAGWEARLKASEIVTEENGGRHKIFLYRFDR